MIGVDGEIVRSHMEGEVRVVDEFRITGVSFRRRDCLCRRCGDDCITVTASEYCADCELLRSPCHT